MGTTATTKIKPTCHICESQDVQFFCEKKGYRLYDCNKCRFTFVFPIPDDLAAIYAQNYFKNEGRSDAGYTDYDKDKEAMREVFELYLKKLAALTSGRNIFDVGAATGYFLDIAKLRGWKTFGSEISDYAVNEGRRRGHEIIQGSIIGVQFKEKMDAVTLWDVLEHVDDPRGYLRAVNQMLGEGGMLAINTVDRSSLWARTMGPRWHLIVPPEHLNYFSPQNLKTILEECGFEMLEVKKIGKNFSLSYIFKMLASWQGLSFWNWCARMTDNHFFRMFAIPINLRDNVFVLARKVSGFKDGDE
jgi:2-polyprenyl-3-methyl-5-hydroxy-6-metoxy-1,4-benzoquinol methylase